MRIGVFPTLDNFKYKDKWYDEFAIDLIEHLMTKAEDRKGGTTASYDRHGC